MSDRFLGPFKLVHGMDNYSYEPDLMALMEYHKADGTKYKHVFFKCPCGGDHYSCLPVEGDKKWDLTVDDQQRPTMHPSIQQIAGCNSHFFIRDGYVDFC